MKYALKLVLLFPVLLIAACGLALDVAGCLTGTSDRSFVSGEVFSIRVGMREPNESAIVSAMIAITASGHEVLWPGARQ